MPKNAMGLQKYMIFWNPLPTFTAQAHFFDKKAPTPFPREGVGAT